MATLTNAHRNSIVAWCEYFHAHEHLINYVQKRPFALYSASALEKLVGIRSVINEWDCSGSTIEIYYLAGAQDPSGFNFDGDGDTESMLSHLTHYHNPMDAHPGALVLIGINLPLAQQHVCIVTDQGEDPEVFSHGSAFNCELLPLSVELTAHPGADYVFLNVGNLG
jgi:hypothetical protein